MSRTWIVVVLLSAVLGIGARAAADPLTLRLDPQKSSVGFVLGATMHKVDGRLGPASGAIRFDPATGQASGSIVIDLTHADTGNSRRDQKMHEKILETGDYPVATYRVTRISFEGPLHPGTNDLQLHGELDIRGATHPIDVLAQATLDGHRVHATGALQVPYVDWGLEDPSFFVLRVAKQVDVELTIEGTLEGELPGTAAAPAATGL